VEGFCAACRMVRLTDVVPALLVLGHDRAALARRADVAAVAEQEGQLAVQLRTATGV
jgi:hypothetical protein